VTRPAPNHFQTYTRDVYASISRPRARGCAGLCIADDRRSHACCQQLISNAPRRRHFLAARRWRRCSCRISPGAPLAHDARRTTSLHSSKTNSVTRRCDGGPHLRLTRSGWSDYGTHSPRSELISRLTRSGLSKKPCLLLGHFGLILRYLRRVIWHSQSTRFLKSSQEESRGKRPTGR